MEGQEYWGERMMCTTGVLKEKVGEIWIWTKIKG